MGAVRFQVIGKVDGVPRVVLEHVTRTAEDQMPEWPKPTKGDGCYRVVVTGEPMMELEFSHHGEHGDHNVSGMIVTAQRLVNAVPGRRRRTRRPGHRPRPAARHRAGAGRRSR